jgi:cell division protein FtsB
VRRSEAVLVELPAMPPAEEGRRRTRRRKPPRSVLALRWLGIAVVAGIVVGYAKPLQSFQSARNDVERQRAELRELERENARLGRQLALAETDEFIAREARKDGRVRKGEQLFIVDTADWRARHGG